MVGLTVTSFKTKAADHLNHTGNIQAGQALLPDVIAPQRLLQLLPNLQTLDLCEGVQTDTLFSGSVLTAFTGITQLHLKMQPAQLQSSLATLRNLPAQLGLDICANGKLPARLTSEDFPESLVALKLSGVQVCLQSMQQAGILAALTALRVDGNSLCPCCHLSTIPLLATCKELVSLTLDSAALSAGQYLMMGLADLRKLTSLTLSGIVCPGMLTLLQYVGSGLRSITLQLTDLRWQEASMAQRLCQIACSPQLTTLHVGCLMGSSPLFVLSVLPFLENLSLTISVDDSDTEAPARLRALTVSPYLKQVSLDFTTTNRTLVSLITCQLFALAVLLEKAQFSSDKASRFVTPSQQRYTSVVELKLQRCLSVDDQGLRDTIACFPSLTSVDVSSPSVTAAGVQALMSLTRLQRLSIVGCPLVQQKDLRKFVTNMRHLGVLILEPQVVKRLRKHQRKARRDMLLDDGVCRQM